MAIDSHFIPAFSIADVLLDKDTGAPLSGGLVYFEQDDQRGTLKPIYQITGTSPNYNYTQLPNPMTLSSIGTFQDSMANPVVPYFFPYDSEFNPEYYYVRVTSSEDVPQFDREAVPYIPSTSDSTVANVLANEISNPQFAEVLFDTTTASSYTYSVNAVTDHEIDIAPDWVMIISASAAGTLTLSQLTPTGSLNILSNPGTILNVSSSGLSKLQLRQRLYGSPNLWGQTYLAASFVAKTYSGTSSTIDMYYSQSNGTVVNELLVSGDLPSSGDYTAFPGNALIPVSDSSENYPDSYIDIYFALPLSIEIDITSIMVASTGTTSIEDITYDQSSLSRQIDNLYHYAYPIVPIGTVIDFAGFIVPDHYYLCDGSAKDRISNYLLFKTLTTTETVTLTNTVTTFTVVSAADYHIGMAIEGTGIPASTTISNIVGTTITMSAAATASASSTVTFFAYGAGDGSTTFNMPNLLGFTTAGANGTLFGSGLNGVGYQDGSATSNALLAHTHGIGSPLVNFVGTGSGGSGPFAGSAGSSFSSVAATASAGSGSSFSIVQPTALMKKCIRFE